MPYRILTIIILSSATLFKVSIASAAPLSEYQDPSELKREKAWDSYYPGSEARMNRSASVKLTFMVDKKGDPFEIMINNSTNSNFNKAAVKAIKKISFNPAVHNGEVVIGRMDFTIPFQSRVIGTQRASKFMVRNNSFVKEMAKENPSKKLAEEHLIGMRRAKQPMGGLHGHLLGAELKYAEHFGTIKEKERAARKAILPGFSTLGGISVARNYGHLIRWQIELGYYGEALLNYERMIEIKKALKLSLTEGQKVEKPKSYATKLKGAVSKQILFILNEQTRLLEESIDQIRAIRDGDKPFAREIALDESGSTNLELLKRTFYIQDVKGKIQTLKLRCQTKFLEINFNVEDTYSLPESFGHCNLQIKGSNNSRATLVQQ